MVRPAHFGYNPETADNNVFQNADTNLTAAEIEEAARAEFDQMVQRLKEEGVQVIVIEDTPLPVKTDAVFPNNWISTHHNGDVILYPMFSPNRRLERRADIMEHLSQSYDLSIDESLLKYEEEGLFLEGTGSMILDREHSLIYACYSERTHVPLLEELGKKMNYEVVGFQGVDDNGIPYYHTNVIMTLGQHIAIICTASIEDINERNNVLNHLVRTKKEVVEISREQVLQFAGNMLEVEVADGPPLMVMSRSAYDSLTKDQLYIIKKYNKIVYLPLSTIEKFGGGSARCMMAEIFLPNLA